MNLRALTYNIHGWRTMDDAPNLDQVARVIGDTGADIVGLNEVYYPRVSPGAIAGSGQPALEALAAHLGMHFVFGPCVRWPAQDHIPADAFGNALLSRWEIIASASHHLTPVAGKEQRGLLEGRILLPGGTPFTVYVTHLDHTDEAARLVQLRALRSWTVRDRNRPHLVMGDFNAVSPWDFAGREDALERLAQSKGYHMVVDIRGSDPRTNAGRRDGPQVIPQMEKAGYTDVYRLAGTPGAQSFIPMLDPPIRIDYIFANQPLAGLVRSASIWQEPAGEEASDHRPALAEFDLSQLGQGELNGVENGVENVEERVESAST